MKEMPIYPRAMKIECRIRTIFGPNRSYILPTMVSERAYMDMLRKKAKEMELRVQPKSAMSGLKTIPMDRRAPASKKSMTKAANKTYHP